MKLYKPLDHVVLIKKNIHVNQTVLTLIILTVCVIYC